MIPSTVPVFTSSHDPSTARSALTFGGWASFCPFGRSGCPTLSALVHERVGRSSVRPASANTVRPAPATVQSSIPAIPFILLNQLIPACYSFPCITNQILARSSAFRSRPLAPYSLSRIPRTLFPAPLSYLESTLVKVYQNKQL